MIPAPDEGDGEDANGGVAVDAAGNVYGTAAYKGDG
jgi:hypothetical protein